jgi:TRAP-type mannitol/chloroaromatic compound transport system permease small subunit
MAKRKKGILSLVGFILFILGFAALALQLLGVQFAFLTWIDAAGRLPGFLIRLAMIIGGIILLYFDQSNWREQE